MSQENVEVVRAMYEHWARGDFPASFIDSDVKHSRIGAQTPDMEGEWRGIEALSREMVEYLHAFTDLRIEAEEIIDLDDDRVLVLSRHTARGKLSGAPIDHELGDLFTLRAGKVVRYDSYWDRAEAMKTVGLSETPSRDTGRGYVGGER
ncbi:MAG TPA: nuclear transport factor 2 family protein [Solirubrobacterales bacterium]|jgi:ketosteroid isomerase-like protein|nr:nuclear transport factor 2 family protein [Solirubrobacterales bacterium]